MASNDNLGFNFGPTLGPIQIGGPIVLYKMEVLPPPPPPLTGLPDPDEGFLEDDPWRKHWGDPWFGGGGKGKGDPDVFVPDPSETKKDSQGREILPPPPPPPPPPPQYEGGDFGDYDPEKGWVEVGGGGRSGGYSGGLRYGGGGNFITPVIYRVPPVEYDKGPNFIGCTEEFMNEMWNVWGDIQQDETIQNILGQVSPLLRSCMKMRWRGVGFLPINIDCTGRIYRLDRWGPSQYSGYAIFSNFWAYIPKQLIEKFGTDETVMKYLLYRIMLSACVKNPAEVEILLMMLCRQGTGSMGYEDLNYYNSTLESRNNYRESLKSQLFRSDLVEGPRYSGDFLTWDPKTGFVYAINDQEHPIWPPEVKDDRKNIVMGRGCADKVGNNNLRDGF